MQDIIIPILAGLATYFLTVLMIRIGGLRLDVPGSRSSHSRPTPRGGGVAIVLVTGLTSAMLSPHLGLRLGLLLVFAFLGGLVGAIDDIRNLPARLRLGAYFVASLGIVVASGGFAVRGASDISVEFLALSLAVCWVANLFNFMDGINGIAGLQGAVALTVYAMITWQTDRQLALLSAVTAATCIGFLPWNFPKAQIFMGDVGSIFLGLLSSGICLAVSVRTQIPLWICASPIFPFILDATAVLARRTLCGESLAVAHRSHTYQVLATRLGGHTSVSLLYAALALACSLFLIGKALQSQFLVSFGVGGVLCTAIVILPTQITQLVQFWANKRTSRGMSLL